MKWEKMSNALWRSSVGHRIIRQRWAGKHFYLLYQPNESLDGGDYSSHQYLSDAKRAA